MVKLFESERNGASIMDFTDKGKRVAVCHGPHCSLRGSPALFDLLEREVAAQGLEDRVGVRPGACNNLCEIGPSMVVHPDKVWYAGLTPEAIIQIVRQHLAGGEPVKRWVARELGSPPERDDRPRRAG
ncbi:MAG: (2Fe-2S) ferredoxin domain-containing protein [Chloroflexia bacterium]